MATPTTEDDTILKKIEGYFRESVRDSSWKSFLKNAVKVNEYKENEQWTEDEIKELVTIRHQPLYINNQVKVTIDRLNGQFAQLKTRIALRPRTKADQKLADLYSDIFRFIYQNNNLEFEERDCADDGFTGGRGVLDIQVEFDDTLLPQIKIRAEDSLAIHPDPHSKHYDWNEDALYVNRSKWVDVNRAVELFPEHGVKLRGMLSSEDPARGDLAEKDKLEDDKEGRFVDIDRQRIRLVEVQYKKFKRETLWLADDEAIPGDEISDAAAKKRGLQRLDRMTHKIFLGVFTEGLLLSHEETEKERFSFVQFIVHRKKSGEPYGPAWAALPLQDSINKRGSKAMHLLSSRRVKYEKGAITDRDALAEELAKPDGQVEIEDGFFAKFEFEDNRDLAAAHMQFHDSDIVNFRRVTGINPESLSEKSELRSGAAIDKKISQANTVTAGAFDNFRRTRVAMSLTIMDCVQHYYTPRKIELVTDDSDAAKVIDLDPDTLNAMKQARYDVVVATVPSLANIEEDQFNVLSQLIPQMSQASPFWARMLLSASSLRDKDKFIKQLDQLPKGPQISPKMTITAQLDAMSPIERAYLYQQMGADEIAETVMQENRPTTDMLKLQGIQMKLQGDLAKIKAQIELTQQKMEAEGHKAELEAQIADEEARAAIAQAKIDIVLAQMELEKERLEIEKAELGVEKAKVDVEGKKAQVKAQASKPKAKAKK